ERDILELNAQNNDTSDKEKAEIAQKIAEINEANAQMLEIETTQQNKLNSIRKEASAKALEAVKAQQDAAIKANEEALNLFIAEQGFRKKSSEEQLEIARQTRDKEIEILDQELEFKRITREAYLAQVTDLNNDFLQKQAEIAVENAEQERDEILKNLGKRKNDYAEFTAENLANDIAYIQDKLLAEEEYEAIRLQQGRINQEEYNKAIGDLKEDTSDAEHEAQSEYDVANIERELLDLEDQRLIDEENLLPGFEVTEARLDQQRSAEIAAA